MPARVDELARSLIKEHGTRAILVAVERLNQSIDERDIHSRDFWAQVVHAIHEHQPLAHARSSASLVAAGGLIPGPPDRHDCLSAGIALSASQAASPSSAP